MIGVPLMAAVIAIMGMIGLWCGWTAPASAAEPEAGKALFAARCALCHAPGGMGAFMLGRRLGAAHSDLTTRTNLQPDYVRLIVRRGIGAMPYFTKVDLSDEELLAISQYLGRAQVKP